MTKNMAATSMQNIGPLCVGGDHHELCGSERNDCFRFRSSSVGCWRRRIRCVKMKAKAKMEISMNEKKLNSNNGGGEEYLIGKFVEDLFVYRQCFVIRSYEIGPDQTATMETLMNLLQETALNHVRSSGVAGNGFGATREMTLRKLIWVVTRIHVQVDKFSSWGDVVEIETWVDAAGKNGMRRDWIIRESKSGRIISRASSTWVMMNEETRRLCKFPEQAKNELRPFFLNRAAIPAQHSDTQKIEKLTHQTANKIRTGLAPRWSDMDVNQHVNNVKYIGWLLESVPTNILEDYNMSGMTLEYRRECRQSNVLESLTSIKEMKTDLDDEDEEDESSSGDLECTHLLRMEADQAEIVRARSHWHLKQPHHDDDHHTINDSRN